MPVRKARIRSWWPLGALLLAAAVASLALACSGGGDSIEITFASPTATAEPEPPTPTPTPSPTATPTPTPDVCGPNPDPASAQVLQVEEPKPGDRVKSPFHVRGWGSEIGLDSNGVVVALVDAAGNPKPTLDAPPQPRTGRVAPPGLKVTANTAPFGVDLLVPNLTSPTAFCVWAFASTDEQGNAKQVVQVPVIVAP